MTLGDIMEEVTLWERLFPWISGGGAATLLMLVKWLYDKYVARSNQHWQEADQIRDELRESRDYWRNEAKSKQDLIQQYKETNRSRKELISKLTEQNEHLSQQNEELREQTKNIKEEVKELRAQNVMLKDQRDNALAEVERLKQKHGEF